jgi:hypothetical protein
MARAPAAGAPVARRRAVRCVRRAEDGRGSRCGDDGRHAMATRRSPGAAQPRFQPDRTRPVAVRARRSGGGRRAPPAGQGLQLVEVRQPHHGGEARAAGSPAAPGPAAVRVEHRRCRPAAGR